MHRIVVGSVAVNNKSIVRFLLAETSRKILRLTYNGFYDVFARIGFTAEARREAMTNQVMLVEAACLTVKLAWKACERISSAHAVMHRILAKSAVPSP
jgi:4-hydroxy-3-methylbut-2-enyl diphosphate reductase IspH